MVPILSPIRPPRPLKKTEERVLRSLMTRKYYDRNHPGEKRLFPILRRAFVPADYQGNPTVVLLCQYTRPDKRGYFEFCVYTDGLYGPGHWASDKFGSGTMKTALAAFESSLVRELLGIWPSEVYRVLTDATQLASG